MPRAGLGIAPCWTPSALAEKPGAELEARLLLWGHFPRACSGPDSGASGCAGLAVGERTRNKQWRRNLNLLWSLLEPAGSKRVRAAATAGHPARDARNGFGVQRRVSPPSLGSGGPEGG